jgi:hypothetical protein
MSTSCVAVKGNYLARADLAKVIVIRSVLTDCDTHALGIGVRSTVKFDALHVLEDRQGTNRSHRWRRQPGEGSNKSGFVISSGLWQLCLCTFCEVVCSAVCVTCGERSTQKNF